jgi:hypothetical protein
MGEIIFEAILLWLFIYPGAATRWAISRGRGSKKTFKEFLKDDQSLNGWVGLMTTVFIFVLFYSQ